MNINASLKIQNVRSLNLSLGIDITRKKIDALTHESDDIIFIINTQIGKNKSTVQREFLTCRNGPYMTYFNSDSSRAAGVGIAIKLCADIEVLDMVKDNNDRILILKTMIDNEIITLVSFYDTNENKDCYLNTVEDLLTQIDVSQGVIIGSDFNNFIDNIKDQKGNQAKPHYRTKATAKHNDWKESHKFIDIYRYNNPDGRDLTYLKDGNDRMRLDKGSRLDKFLVTEDLLIKEVTFNHTKDHFYTMEYGMQGHSFDHSSVRMTYNITQKQTGPGQFKLDPFLIKTGALDSIIKQTIFEANLFNTEDEGLMKIYEEINKIVVPLLQRIMDIEKERTETNNPGLDEEEEHYILGRIETQDAKLPRMNYLIERNKLKADRVLTDIQNGVITKVKTVQIQLKKVAKNKLKTLITNLGRLNNELEQAEDEATRNRMLEAREAFQSQYSNHFRREAEKTTYFKQMNLEKPTKWFLNLASKQQTIQSPSNKLRKNGKKYENIKEVLTDVHGFYENIFSLRQRPTGVSIENFLGELKDRPEVLSKKLTEAEKEETNKKIEEKELKDALEKVSSGKTPGIDGIEREFLLRFWKFLGTTITQATEIYIEREKLNSFMDRGLIKVIQKGDTTGEELKNWRPITLLSQIYKLISGVVAGRMKKLLKKLISGCQKTYQNTANIGEILLDIFETIAICNYHKKNSHNSPNRLFQDF